ncbi:MAG TPA: hypothetical protein VF462_11070 [Micromonosporaceae bacterium]
MTLSSTVIAPPPTAPRWRHFFRHALEMVVAMTVGMVLLAPAWAAALDWTGLSAALNRPDLVALIAATDMTVAMTVWMLYRGHGRARIVEMAAAMYLPYLVLIVPYWLGILPGEHIMMGGHVLMLPAMAVAMLAHRAEYTRHHGGADVVHPLIGVLGHRWPTWLALTMSLDYWHDPTVPTPWLMLLLPSAYLFFGGIRGHLRDPRLLALQLAGLVLYLVLAVVAAYAEPATAAWIVAAGWGFHALWDLAHHRADVVAPRWWSEWCGVVDAVIAVTIVLLWL